MGNVAPYHVPVPVTVRLVGRPTRTTAAMAVHMISEQKNHGA
jgi:hypothetical protein